mmetsp:Transcript_8009/g.23686  ORF Transcript_8009/g.23686 Transcript_8009/m.23686 type:complete len:270 (+) Transcript_8009:1312-2121(+)
MRRRPQLRLLLPPRLNRKMPRRSSSHSSSRRRLPPRRPLHPAPSQLSTPGLSRCLSALRQPLRRLLRPLPRFLLRTSPLGHLSLPHSRASWTAPRAMPQRWWLELRLRTHHPMPGQTGPTRHLRSRAQRGGPQSPAGAVVALAAEAARPLLRGTLPVPPTGNSSRGRGRGRDSHCCGPPPRRAAATRAASAVAASRPDAHCPSPHQPATRLSPPLRFPLHRLHLSWTFPPTHLSQRPLLRLPLQAHRRPPLQLHKASHRLYHSRLWWWI